jgi:signal transduction histidine kinase
MGRREPLRAIRPAVVAAALVFAPIVALLACFATEALRSICGELRDAARRESLSEFMGKTEAEKLSLAREIHDGLAQDVAFEKSELERLSRAVAGESPELSTEFNRLSSALATTLECARALCAGLRSLSVLRRGLPLDLPRRAIASAPRGDWRLAQSEG